MIEDGEERLHVEIAFSNTWGGRLSLAPSPGLTRRRDASVTFPCPDVISVA